MILSVNNADNNNVLENFIKIGEFWITTANNGCNLDDQRKNATLFDEISRLLLHLERCKISVVPTSADKSACTCALSCCCSLRHSCCGWIASFLGHRVHCPEDACPERFSWFFYWIPKVQKGQLLFAILGHFALHRRLVIF